MQTLMMKRLKFSVVVGRGPTKVEVEQQVMLGIDFGVMRAGEHVESLEDTRDGSLVERTRTHLWPIDYGYLKVEG